MTTLFEPNEDARSLTLEQGAAGPRVGFMEAFAASMDAQMRTSSQFGIEYAMQAEDWAQTRALLEAGVEDAPQLILSIEGRGPGEEGVLERSVGQTLREDSGYYEDFIPERSRPYFDAARASLGEGVDDETRKGIEAYDTRIRELRAQRPDLKLATSDEMFAKVKSAAQRAELSDQTQQRTLGGTLGGFLGGALASLHPATDPLNFATLGLGGAGKSALTRIAVQTGSQGLIETINQFTGVQREREMLGLSYGMGDALTRIGATAAGAGVLQGAGELVVAGAKRFFRSTPTDPAPPVADLVTPPKPLALPHPDQFKTEAGAARVEQSPSALVDYLADQAPLSGIRVGRSRTVADLKQITDTLDRWDAPYPAFARPRTPDATYFADPPSARVDVTAAVNSSAAYQAAREVDPQAFGRYEKLTERAATFRRWIDDLAQTRDAEVQTTFTAIDNRVTALYARIETLEARKRSVQGIKNKTDIKAQVADTRAAIAQAKADRERVLKLGEKKETPDIAAVRRELIKTDEQMRELAPLLGRAHVRARGEWADDLIERGAYWEAYKAGRTVPEIEPKSALPTYDVAVTLADRVPAMQRATPETTGATAIETVQKVLEAEAKIVDEGLDAFRETIKALFGKEADGKYRVGDHEFDIDKDTINVVDEDGNAKEVTIREMLDENREAEAQLEALSSCSMPRRS